MSLTKIPRDREAADAPAVAPLDLRVPARGAGRRTDLLLLAGYLLAGVVLLGHMYVDLPHRVLASNINDEAFFEWALAHGARVFGGHEALFLSYRMNVPAGVNLMANTGMLGLTLPLAPLTMLLGPHLTLVLLLTLCPAATAAAWYLVLVRHLVRSRSAAFLAGALCGFGPGMVAHDQGHPNIVAQFLIPFIVWRVLALCRPGRWLRDGVLLALLVTWQALINEEILFVTALACGLFLLGYGALRRDEARTAVRPLLAGASVAALLAGALLAYPLYVQFCGPQHYRGLNHWVQDYGADLGSFVAFGRLSIGGVLLGPGRLAQNAAEENSFLGWPLLVLVVGVVWWLRRRPAVLALAGTGLVLAFLSLGRRIRLDGHATRLPGPFTLLNRLPLFDSMVPTRLALGVAPVAAILLALACDTMVQRLREAGPPDVARAFRLAWHGLLAAALLPLAFIPLGAVTGAPIPRFITDGTWRRYVPEGRTLVSVPLTRGGYYVEPMRWAADQDLNLAIPRGYFLGPAADAQHPTDLTGIFGAPDRPTSTLFDQVCYSGRPATIGPEDRAAARSDLTYWRAAAVVLAPQQREEALWKTTTDLLGFPPTWVDGVWLWDVRASTR